MRKNKLAAGIILAALLLGALPAAANHLTDGGVDEAWTNAMNSTTYWEDRFGGPGLEVDCTQYTSHNGTIPAQYDAAVVKDGTMVRVYDKAGPYTALGPVNPANGEHFAAPHSWVMKCQVDEVDYCNPADKPSGPISDWVPDDVDCVDFDFEKVCGSLSWTLRDDVVGIPYAVAAELAPATYDLGNATFTSPLTFPEDHNGGSIDIDLYLVGGESDYVTGRNIPNYWEESAVTVTVDTDCQETTTTTTIPEETTTTEPEATTTTQPETSTTVPEETTSTSSPEETTTTEAEREVLPFTDRLEIKDILKTGMIMLAVGLAILATVGLGRSLTRKENI